MLIYRFDHPLLHNAARVRTVDVDIDTRCFILKPHTRTRGYPFVVHLVAKMRQKTNRLLVSKVLRPFLESIN